MRYYVVLESPFEDIPPYVLAEVARERFDDGLLRDSSLAASLAGARARIMTEEEIDAMPWGRAARKAWRAGDDRAFDEETRQLLAAIEPVVAAHPGLRLVSSEPGDKGDAGEVPWPDWLSRQAAEALAARRQAAEAVRVATELTQRLEDVIAARREGRR